MSKPNPTPPILTEQDIKRFWSHVNKEPGQGPHGDCWEWIHRWRCRDFKDRSKWYYPGFYIGSSSTVKAHRVSIFLATGKWPSAFGLHRCDNPPCIRPDHLFDGTHQDNMDDMKAKKRHVSHARPDWTVAGARRAIQEHPERILRGMLHGHSKLTDKDIPKIRALYATGRLTQTAIGNQFGVGVSTISDIVRGKRWGHV